MRFRKDLRAWIVLAVAFVGAVWLYSYRASFVISYVDPDGRHFHPDRHLRVQPWWGTPAAVGLAVIGAALFVRLIPARKRLLRICASRLTNVS